MPSQLPSYPATPVHSRPRNLSAICGGILAAIGWLSLAAPQAVAGVNLVQHASKDAGTSSSAALAFPANNTAGNWIGVVIRAGHSGQVLSVSDTRGNTYKQAVQFNQTLDAPNGETLAIYYAENIAGGANTVTVSESLANNTLRFAILEYSGLATSNSMDVTSAAQGSGTTLNSGTATTSVGGDLILGEVAAASGVTFTAGSGYTIEERVPAAPNTKLIAEDGIQATAGPVTVSASLSASENGGALLAAFKSAASGTLPPSITSLNPTSGAVGTSVTIAGANFGGLQGSSTVTFNGTAATPTSWSASSITVNVPSGATSGNAIVTVGGVQSNSVSFTVTPPPPSITSLSPTSGPVGTTVTIFGANFSNAGGTSTVTFNGAFAGGGTWTSSYITVQVPGGATTGNVVVTVNGVASNGVAFVVTPPPTITSLSPTIGLVGTSVVISGANFGASQGTSTVTFNGTASTPTSWSATSIAVSVPTAASTGNVVVTVGGVATNGAPFTVIPSITSLNPSSGPGTISVTITGNGFGAAQGGSSVTFGGIAATPISWSNTSIVVPVPNNGTAGTVTVFVTVGGVASNSVNFTVTPIINTISPTSAQVGAAVTISGTNFGPVQNSSTVTFSGIAATPISWSSTSIVAPVPTGAVTGNVIVTVGGQVSNAFTFILTGPPPNISTLTPNNGPVGTSVNIAGANFGASQGTSTITFNGVSAATASSWSASSITVSVPPGATTGSVIVTVGGQASDALTFTVTVPGPSISALTPNNGPVGTSVTIAGSNFGASQGTSTVTFNGVSAGTASSWSASTITVNVPSGATTGNVVVTANGVASNSVNFTVPAPAPNILSVAPSNGPVGASVTIAGANFGAPQGTSTITFNGVSAGTATNWSGSSMTVNVPPGATTGNVVVSVGGQTSNGLSFTVTPTISSATNNNTNFGPVGTLVTITGTNFGASQGTSTVTFNGVATTPTFWSSTSILAPVPNGAATGPVTVTVGGFASNGVNFVVTPKITGLNPSSGPLGTAVTVSGSNFGATQGSSQLTFGGVGDNPTGWRDTSLTVVTPPNLGAGTWGLQVFVGGQGSNALGFLLTPGITNLSQTSGPLGTLVTITGSSFGAAQGSNTVTFNGTVATPTSWSGSSIVVAVPSGATTGNVVVTANGVASNGVLFTVTTIAANIALVQHTSKDAGVVTSSSSLAFPSNNTAGNWIGVLIRTGHSGQTLTVNDTRGNTYKQAMQSNETLDTPNGETFAMYYAENIAAGANTVTVTESITNNTLRFGILEYSGVATSSSLDVIATAQGTGTAPSSGSATTTAGGDLVLGMVVTANGSTMTAGTGFTIEERVPAAPNTKLIAEDEIKPVIGAVAANTTLAASDNWGAGLAAFKAASGGSVGPIIRGLSVSSAWVGVPITITGANFGATQGTNTVTFNGTVATPTSWSATNIVAPVPSGATTGNLVVTVGGVQSNAVSFTVTPPPANITSLNPTSGQVGTSVTVSGANFGATQGTSTVTFNGTSAGTATSWSASSITVNVPTGATTGNVVVTVNGLQSNSVNFTVINPTPIITSLTPNSGSVGTSVTINGTNFGSSQGASAVVFNGATAIPSSWSATSIVVPVPVGALTGTVAVTVGGVTSNGVTFAVTVPPPTIVGMNPSSAVAGSGAFTLTVNGTNFLPSSVIQWNGSARTTAFLSSTQLQAAITSADIAGASMARVTVSNPGLGGTVSSPSPFFVGTSGGSNFAVMAVNQEAQDIVYDPKNEVFYLSVTGAATSNSNTISVLDPTAAAITSAQPTGSNPNMLGISDDSQFLYAGIDGAASVQRFILPGLAPDISYALGSGTLGPYSALDLQVAPHAPHTTAVTLGNSGVSPAAQGGIFVFDDATPRTATAAGGSNLFGSIQWGADATALYASNDESTGFDFYTLSVNSGGVALGQDFQYVFRGFSDKIHFDAGTNLIYAEEGHVISPSTGLPVGNFNAVGPMVVDSNLNTAFFLSGGSGSGATIQAFDLTHFALIGSAAIPSASGTLSHLIRWGQDGLAFLSTGANGSGQVFLVGGSFVGPAPAFVVTPPPTPVIPATPLPNAPTITALLPSSAIAGGAAIMLTVNGTQFDPTAVVQFNGGTLATTFVSSTQLQATIPASDILVPGAASITVANPAASGGSSSGSAFFVGASGGISSAGTGFAAQIVNQAAKDMVFDPIDQLLYFSVPNTNPAGNTIAVLDPSTAQIVGEQYAGSNPNIIAISDDGQFLYAGIDGSSSVQRFILPSLATDIGWSLGAKPADGPLFALDLQVAPGVPHTTAVTSGTFNGSPVAEGGISIFDDAVMRPTIAGGFLSGGGLYDALQWGSDVTTLYAANSEDTGFDFYALSVNSTGVVLTSDYPNSFSSFSNRIHFDNGTKLVYSDDGHVVNPSTGVFVGTFPLSGLVTPPVMVPDSNLNVGFFAAKTGGSSVAIYSFNLTTFAPISSILIPNVTGNPLRLVRWRQNGLAFNTNAGEIVLVGGNFVH